MKVPRTTVTMPSVSVAGPIVTPQSPDGNVRRSGQLDRHPLHRIPGLPQFVGILVKAVDGVEQALTQHFIAEFFDRAHQVESRGFVVVRDRIEGLAQVASGTGHTITSFITNGGHFRTVMFHFNFKHLPAMLRGLIQINKIWACSKHMDIRIFTYPYIYHGNHD